MELAQLIAGLIFIAAALARLEDYNSRSSHTLAEEYKLVETGLPPEGIPSIDKPKFVNVREAIKWLAEREPVMLLKYRGEERGYPLQLMIWHEIVNDYFKNDPILLTFSAVSNSPAAYRRQVKGRTLYFGTSGKFSCGATAIYDRQTGSLWQQFTGECIKGKFEGVKLESLPLSLISFRDFMESYPERKVLSRETGYQRKYGWSPYVGYGRADDPPYFYQGRIDQRLLPKERIIGIPNQEEAVAYPYSLLRQQGMRGVIQEKVKKGPLVIFYSRGMNSVVDTASIRYSRDAGTAVALSPLKGGDELEFYPAKEGFKDTNTESVWSITGRCLDGYYKGEELQPFKHLSSFWFAWALHYPHTKIYKDI